MVAVLLIVAFFPVREQFLDESSFQPGARKRYQRYADGSILAEDAMIVVLLFRGPVLQLVRSRSRTLADAQDAGAWRAAAATAVLNAVYVLVVVGPGRWAVSAALTAHATGSDQFRASDDVVAEAGARYVDRATVLLLLAMVLHASVVHFSARGRRRLRVPDGRLTS